MVDVSSSLLAGTASFVADLDDPRLADAAHAVFVRSQAAHARFRVDLTEAESAAGVLAVIDADGCDIVPAGAYSPLLSPRFAQPLLAETRVRHVGEPVAVIVAATRAQALDAAELVVVDYDELAPVLTVAESVADDVLLFADDSRCRSSSTDDAGPETNVVRRASDGGFADPHDPAPFEAAEVVVRLRAFSPRQVAAPIECRGAAVVWDDGDLHVWMSTQTPHGFRNRIAPMYGLERDRVHVIAGPFVGGGFGGKGAPGPEEQILPALARRVGRAVVWHESRTENLTAAPQGRSELVDITVAGNRDGRLTALRLEIHKDAGAYPSSGAGLPNMWGRPTASGVYDIPHVEFDSVTAVTNGPPVSALRGAGRTPSISTLERAVDRFAAEVGLDPAEVRRRNLIPPERLPATMPTGANYDEADHPAALAAALDAVGIDEVRREQARRRGAGGPLQLGVGIGAYVIRTMGNVAEQAIVRVETDGSATVMTGTTDQGQQHEATWRTIASAELGIAPDAIRVIEGHTDLVATGAGAVGSRSVQTAGMAVHTAAVDVVSTARDLAADLLEAAPDDVVLDREIGRFHVAGTPARSLGWAELAVRGLEDDRELVCDFTYDPEGRDAYPSGVHIAVVEVDVETGRWQLAKYVAADDAGVRVNPASVDGQLHGGIALGLGQVLGEACTFDESGQPRNTNLLDYPAISIDQVVQFDLIPFQTASSVNTFGWKGVGESGPVGATAAVWNAVVDSVSHLGVDHIDLPCSPDRVWRAIRDASSEV